MKTPHAQDPPRWKDLPPAASGGVQGEIGAAIRLMRSGPRSSEGPVPFPGLGAVSARGPRPRRGTSLGATLSPAWFGRTALIAASLLLGGVAAALSEKFIEHFNKARARSDAAASIGSTPARTAHRKLPAMAAPSDALTMSAVAVPTGSASTSPDSSPFTGPTRRRIALADDRRQPAGLTVTPARPPVPSPMVGRGAPAAPGVIAPLPFQPPDDRPGDPATWVSPAVKRHPDSGPAHAAISEGAIIARAMARMRHDHDPLWALDDLDEHDRKFPGGKLNREAALARAEALLALNRGNDALVVLDALNLEPTATDRRARLARAELRAQDGRRAEAIGDFDQVLDNGGDDPLAERALYGRAVCRMRGGDLGGARADLRGYLRHFPQGSRRAEVEKMLRRLGA